MRTDWVGEVFAAMRDSGEDISIIYGSTGPAAPRSPKWFEVQHDQFDGISGFALVLREQGLRPDAVPTLKADRFTLWRGLQGLVAVLPALKTRPRRWHHFNAARPVRSRPVDERLAWKLLTPQETAAIAAAAKDAGVTVNTLLLHHLDAAVTRRLVPLAADRLWMVPVNLRGAVTRPREASPHMAFLGVRIQAPSSLGALQDQVTRLRQRGAHWGAWIALHAGRLVGARGLRADLVKREKKQHGWTGIFSNLGSWSVPGSDGWIFGPAISRVHPVGAGCVTVNGRMALSIQLHDAFGCDLAVSQALLGEWTRSTLQAALPAGAVQASPSTTSQEVAHHG